MKKNLFITAIIAIVLCISCGPKGTSNSNASEEEKVDYLLRDTAIYGFCAEGSAMNTLQIITDGGDTITVSTARANEKGKVLGGYAIGDEMAIIVNSDTTQAILVINKSMLNGDWVMPNPMDGSNETGVRILRGGVAEQFTITREDGIDAEEILVYDIIKLKDNELTLRSTDEDQETYEYTHPAGEEYTEEDLNGVVLDEGYDDEFDM